MLAAGFGSLNFLPCTMKIDIINIGRRFCSNFRFKYPRSLSAII